MLSRGDVGLIRSSIGLGMLVVTMIARAHFGLDREITLFMLGGSVAFLALGLVDALSAE